MVFEYAGTWRVNGQLAVARAIGPESYKPYISNQPDICCVELDGDEDFLVMASDGLWDHMTEDDIAVTVYKHIITNPENLNMITHCLAQTAKENGSSDNITVVIIFLKDPKDIILPDCMNRKKPMGSEVRIFKLFFFVFSKLIVFFSISGGSQYPSRSRRRN